MCRLHFSSIKSLKLHIFFWVAVLIASANGNNSYAQTLLPHPERSGIGLEFSQGGRTIAPLNVSRTLPHFDIRSSLFVTDVNSVRQISFAEVLDALVAGTSTTKEQLFHQWWDTANRKPGLQLGAHCDDQSAPGSDGEALMNGFPYKCPRPEGKEATSDPFSAAATSPTAYQAIAYSNRFDLASPDGTDCGEYRVVFARNSGISNITDRNLIIFEARVKNPQPSAGINGCRPILEFWLSLSDPSIDTTKRGQLLKDFYLKGLPSNGVGPVITAANYEKGTGQIRTNQFLDQSTTTGFIWTLREFKIATAGGLTTMVPEDVKANPGNALFLEGSTNANAAAFADEIVAQLPGIRGGASGENSLTSFGFNNAEIFNSFDSNEGETSIGDVLFAFDAKGAGPLHDKLQAALTALGSQLTPDNVVRRIRVLTCAGCHHYSNFDNGLGGGASQWPSSINFTQESESQFETGSDVGPDGPGKRFLISDILKMVLLPARASLMTIFLSQFPTSVTN